MNYYSMTNTAIAAELGHRLEQLRLERNIPQQVLADEIGITAKSYRQMIASGGKLENIIAALRALNCLQQLDNFLPDPPPSPLAQLKLKGKERLRARQITYKTTHEPTVAGSVREPRLDW
jgi:transcriptional regulator with XRE-family HTH domain